MRDEDKSVYLETIETMYTGLDLFEAELKRRGTQFFLGDERPGILDYNVWPWFERMEAFHSRSQMDWGRFPEMVKFRKNAFAKKKERKK